MTTIKNATPGNIYILGVTRTSDDVVYKSVATLESNEKMDFSFEDLPYEDYQVVSHYGKCEITDFYGERKFQNYKRIVGEERRWKYNDNRKIIVFHLRTIKR